MQGYPAPNTGTVVDHVTSLSYQLPSNWTGPKQTDSWTITACNGTNCDSLPALSSWWGFTAADTDASTTQPGAVPLLSPADDAANQGSTPTLSWSAPTGAINGVTQ